MLSLAFGFVALTATAHLAPPDSITIQFDARIPMRDGVTLAADIYRPANPGRYPVVLMRTPYNKNGDAILKEARAFAGRGYVYVAVDVRGRGDSDGDWRPYFFEGDDGYDAIEWCASQSWSTGKIGTIGRSYVGYNQWVAAVRKPPHLAALIALAPMADPFEDVWITGPGGVPMPMGQKEEEEDLDELIDIDKVEGRVKASSLRKIGDIVDKHPEEALSIIRTWLYQET